MGITLIVNSFLLRYQGGWREINVFRVDEALKGRSASMALETMGDDH